MTFLKTGVFTVMVVGVLALSSAAMADHSWGNYHWPRSENPFSLDLGDNVDPDNWRFFMDVASGDWSLSTVLSTSIVNGTTKPRQCSAKKGNVQVCNDSYGARGWLGIASIAIDGDHITAGSVQMNDTYFDTVTYNTPAWRQLVMCQEIGHTFGLDHQDETFSNANLNTCMDYTSDPESNQHPNAHDYEQLETIYAHLDEDTSSDPVSGGGGGCNPKSPKCKGNGKAAEVLATLDMSDPAAWGRLVSGHGPQEVYELRLGRGQKILTHVFWTLEKSGEHHPH